MKNTKTKRILLWTVPTSVLLVICICLGAFFIIRHNNPPFKRFAVVEAKYPVMAERKDYDQWSADRKKQLSFYDKNINHGDFFKATAAEFMITDGDKNAVYSPLNVYMALSMLAEITDGETREQILNLLATESMDKLRAQSESIWNTNYCDDGAVATVLANSVWIDEELPIKKDALKKLAQHYYTSSYKGDFASKDFMDAFKKWLNTQTGELLEDNVNNINFPPETLLALASTVYFRAKWSQVFNTKNTVTEKFHAVSGDEDCKFMKQTITEGDYYWGDNFTAISKELDDSKTVYFVLPNEGVSLNQMFEDDNALEFFSQPETWEDTKLLKINFSLPKFDITSEVDLAEHLKALGITNCFDPDTSDFTALTDENVIIDSANHTARVTIDEEGVLAAAYTVFAMKGGASPFTPPELEEINFVLDRPFIFVVAGSNGLPLFVGAVNHP